MLRPRGVGGTHRVPREAGGSPPFPRVYSNPSPTVDRYRGDTNDTRIVKDKSAWMHKGYTVGSPTGPADFDGTKSGPVRAELHLRTSTYRKESGAFNSSTTGMHTIVPKIRTNRGAQKPKTMTNGRQSRLTTAIYRGQSYSETTIQQGQ